MFSYKANAICMAGMTMPVGASVAASHCWNRVRKPRQLINYARFWPHWWTFAKNRTAHAQTHYRKSTQWQWTSFVSAWRLKMHVLCKVGKNIIFQNKTSLVMFYRHNKTFWYTFCNFKHFLKAENSEDSLASSCVELSIGLSCNPVWDWVTVGTTEKACALQSREKYYFSKQKFHYMY